MANYISSKSNISSDSIIEKDVTIINSNIDSNSKIRGLAEANKSDIINSSVTQKAYVFQSKMIKSVAMNNALIENSEITNSAVTADSVVRNSVLKNNPQSTRNAVRGPIIGENASVENVILSGPFTVRNDVKINGNDLEKDGDVAILQTTLPVTFEKQADVTDFIDQQAGQANSLTASEVQDAITKKTNQNVEEEIALEAGIKDFDNPLHKDDEPSFGRSNAEVIVDNKLKLGQVSFALADMQYGKFVKFNGLRNDNLEEAFSTPKIDDKRLINSNAYEPGRFAVVEKVFTPGGEQYLSEDAYGIQPNGKLTPMKISGVGTTSSVRTLNNEKSPYAEHLGEFEVGIETWKKANKAILTNEDFNFEGLESGKDQQL